MNKKTILTFTGDIGFDHYMSEKWADPELVSEDIRSVFRASDHVIINVEGAVVKREDAILHRVDSVEEQMLHTIDPEAVSFLKKLPADIWNLSNNHIMDAGAMGLKSTLELAGKNNISTIGAGMDKAGAARPLYLDEAGGIGMFSVCYRPDCVEADEEKAGCISWADMDTIERSIKDIRQKCRWCIMVVHGGEEFTSLPSPYTRDRYLKYLEMGADIIIGHHPHVPMNYELVSSHDRSGSRIRNDSSGYGFRDKLIVYSLGNFIFDTDYQRSQLNTDRGMIFSLSLTESGFDYKAYGIKLDRERERVFLTDLPEIFENIPEEEYKKLAPLSAKAFVNATKKQYTFLYPKEYDHADDEKWMDCFMDPDRSGRVPGEALDFEVIYPLAMEAEKGAWKESRLEGVINYILKQL